MIVITTPTGQIGRSVVDRVLAAGRPVRVVVRDPGRLDPTVRDRVEVVTGSTADVDVLTRALAGADTLFWLLPPCPEAPSLQQQLWDFVGPLCAALSAGPVRRVVAVSSLGRGVAKDAGQISAIHAMDALIESTGVAYRSIQPPGFAENLLAQLGSITTEGVFYAATTVDRPVPVCAVRDIAAVAARLLLDDSWTGQEDVPLRGPEFLSNVDMAGILSEVLDRPVRFQPVAPADFADSLVSRGLSPAWAAGIVAMTAAAERGVYDERPGESGLTGPTTFRQWCTEVLVPAAAR